jgi:hypothetical protein
LTLLFSCLELIAASWEARRRGESPRERPVTGARLREVGLERDGLIGLLYQAHVEHRLSRSRSAGGRRVAWGVESTRIRDSSRLALTDAGEQFADEFLARVLVPADAANLAGVRGLLPSGRLVPSYDAEGRVFRWGEHILKHFRQPSPNQEILLRAAQELGWPAWFDDPLPRGHGNAKKRLHDTIKDLNRRQLPYLVHFMGDGTGMRVGWELR